MGILREHLCTFVIISHGILLRMRSISEESCRQNQNTHFVFNNFFFFWTLCCLWDNVEKIRRSRLAIDDNVIWHMRSACWITETTNAHSEYVILTAFLRQQWPHECASMSCDMYIAFLVILWFCIQVMRHNVPRLFQITNLMYNSFIFYQYIYVTLCSSTCFEQHATHPQEGQLYHHSLWYRNSL